MVQASIHGTATGHEKILKEMRALFDPIWIQVFDSGQILIEREEKNDSWLNSLEAFMSLKGYKLVTTETEGIWYGAYFR